MHMDPRGSTCTGVVTRWKLDFTNLCIVKSKQPNFSFQHHIISLDLSWVLKEDKSCMKEQVAGCRPALSESSTEREKHAQVPTCFSPQSTLIFETGSNKTWPSVEWESVTGSAPRQLRSFSQATTQQTRAAPTFPYWANEPRQKNVPSSHGNLKTWVENIAILDPVWEVPS